MAEHALPCPHAKYDGYTCSGPRIVLRYNCVCCSGSSREACILFRGARFMTVLRTSNVDLKVNGEGAYAFVAQPDDDAKHPGIVLIQEWWGIEPHVRDLAQKLAADGFVVAVPDLYHG